MLPRGSFDDSKHPRGYHGRFGFGAGRYSNAHAMTGPRRPRPAEIKRLHAVTPVRGLSAVPSPPRTIVGGFLPTIGD